MKPITLLTIASMALFGTVAVSHAASVSYTSDISGSYYVDAAGDTPSCPPSGCTGLGSYGGVFTDTGTGIVFSGSPTFTDTISASAGLSELRDVSGADTDPLFPSGVMLFAADYTATINIPVTGNYTFGFGSDDAGYLLVNGSRIAAEPGLNGYPGLLPYSVFLTAGTGTIEVQYANEAAAGAVVALQLGTTPLPSTWVMMLTGLTALGFLAFRRKISPSALLGDLSA